jgi:spore maturation protein CgeB
MKALLVHPGAAFSVHDVYVGYEQALRDLGHDIVAYRLQNRLWRTRSWLRYVWKHTDHAENVPKPTAADFTYWASREMLERALRHDVDIVLIVSACYVHPDNIEILHKAGLRVGLILTESPYRDDLQELIVRLGHIAWTNDRGSLEVLRTANPNTFYLPTGFNAAVHQPGTAWLDPPTHDVVFVGAGFAERVAFLEAIDWTGINLGLYGSWPKKRVRATSPIAPFVHDEIIANEVTTALHQHATIGLNFYRTSKALIEDIGHVPQGESMNPRAYELAACGTFQLSEWRPEVEEVFGDAVPTFRTADELSDLIRYYLAHDAERQEKAAAARERVQGHSYHQRAAQVLDDLEAVFIRGVKLCRPSTATRAYFVERT